MRSWRPWWHSVALVVRGDGPGAAPVADGDRPPEVDRRGRLVGVPRVGRVHPEARLVGLLEHARLDALAVDAELLEELRADRERPLAGLLTSIWRVRAGADPARLLRAVRPQRRGRGVGRARPAPPAWWRSPHRARCTRASTEARPPRRTGRDASTTTSLVASPAASSAASTDASRAATAAPPPPSRRCHTPPPALPEAAAPARRSWCTVRYISVAGIDDGRRRPSPSVVTTTAEVRRAVLRRGRQRAQVADDAGQLVGPDVGPAVEARPALVRLRRAGGPPSQLEMMTVGSK